MGFMATTALLSAARTGAGRLSCSASSIVTREVTGFHNLKIDGYEALRKLPMDLSLTSQTFEAVGHRWKIKYMPRVGLFNDYISLYLQIPDDERVQKQLDPVSFKFSLLDQAGNLVPSSTREMTRCIFERKSKSKGFTYFIKYKDLEKSGCLKDGCFSVRCDITLIEASWGREDEVGVGDDETENGGSSVASTSAVVVPPSDLHKHIADLQSDWRGTDTAIVVSGEEFRAHRWLLAARSPVFAEELLASPKGKKDSGAHRIEINDMQPSVFKSLLRYMYTDALPVSTDDDGVATARDLLGAANRYKLERLKLICEDTLWQRIDVNTVAGILAAAEQHQCRALKAACMDFIVASPQNMKDVMKTEGFEEIKTKFPTLLTELVMKKSALIKAS
jgi:speckle-type POZ protein